MARSSPIVPETKMKGTPGLISRTTRSARMPSKPGIEKSERTACGFEDRRARFRPASAWTRSHETSNPPCSSARTESSASSSESSTNNNRTGVLSIGSPSSKGESPYEFHPRRAERGPSFPRRRSGKHDNPRRENRIVQLKQVISRGRVSVWPSTCADEPDCRFVRDRRAGSWPIGGLRPSYYNTADETRSANPDRCFRGAHAHDAAVPAHEGAVPGHPVVLPHGRLLRAVLRRRGQGLSAA